MKITQIALRNFRSGQNLTLDTDAPRVYICGLNGVGKSSIKDAIRWTLRGVCQTTDAKGQGWESLVPAGTTTLSTALVLNQSTLERKYSINGSGRSLQWNGFPASMKDAQDAVYDALSTTPEYLDAVLETDYFLRLHHAEAKSMVLGLLNVRIPFGEESLSLEQVEGRYKKAFSERTEAKARLKSFVMPTFVAPAEGMLPKPDEIQTLLTQRRAELQTLVGQAGEVAGKRKALQAQLEAVTRRPARSVGREVHSEEIAALEASLRELEAKAEELTKKASAFSTSNERTKQEAPDHRQTIEALMAHKPSKGCVLDPNVPCETAKIRFTNQAKLYRASMDPDAPPVVEEPEPISFDYGALVKGKQELDALRGMKREYDTAILVNNQRQDEIDGVMAQLGSLPPDPEIDSTAVEAARARVHKGEQILERSRETWRAHDSHHKAKAQYETLFKDVERLESLCEDLGPNGLRVKALAEAIGAFEEAINRTTCLFGWVVKFSLDPWGVDINGRTIEAYSESEQFRIGVAIQMAIAVASGLGFVVVDRLDMLDAANRKVVTGMVLRAEGLEQAILLATKEPDAKLPSGQGLKAYRLAKTDDGRSVIQEAA